MDLTAEDVVELLEVSPEQLQEWLERDEVRNYRIRGEPRFNRHQVEEWMLRQRSGEKREVPVKGRPYSLYRALHHGGVFHDIAGQDKESIISNTITRIADRLGFAAETVQELFLEREQLAPTALGHGIAVPHTRDLLLSHAHDAVIAVFPAQPIEYGALDGQPVHTLFFLFATSDRRHLQLLAKIAHLCRRPDILQELSKGPQEQELLALLKEAEQKLVTQ